MQQNLTEEQVQEKQELFFTILDDFINENYEVDDDYVMTEDDAYIVSIVKEYFDENFVFPTLQESVLEDITSYDINTPLYEELALVLMDESIGTFIAGARHGISSFLANRAAAKSDTARSKADVANKSAGTAAKTAEKTHKTATKSGAYGSGIIGTVKSAIGGGKVQAAQKRATAAKQTFQQAHAKNFANLNKASDVNKKRQGLANKIDTGITNVKNRVKSAVTTGAQAIGGFIGRAVG